LSVYTITPSWLGGVAFKPLDLRSTRRAFNSTLTSSDPGQVVHTCPASLKLRQYGAIEI